MVLACLFALLLATQLVTSSDLGYHLAYGEQFLATGRPVDTNEFIYTLPQGPTAARAAPPGPGCWYDSQGRYRFANANWLSQVGITVLYHLGGMAAMSLLATACVAVVLATALPTLRRQGIPWTAITAGVVLMALGAWGRFAPRPEIIGYPLIVAQLCLLLGAVERGKALSIRAAVALVALQLVLVNVHSYFLLGLAMTGAMLADQLLRMAWRRLRGQTAPADWITGANVKRLAWVLATQSAACLVNPWTWRLAVLPVQTVLFLNRHGINATEFAGPRHPWSAIAEFTHTLGALSADGVSRSSFPIVGVLVLAGAACLAALVRRRWGLALILAGMGAVALSMLRNVAVASLLIVPAALVALKPAADRTARRGSGPARARATVLAALSLSALSIWWGVEVVTNRFHEAWGSADRFGIGASRLHMPLGAAGWLNEHRPTGRMWTDFNGSSNLHYFTHPHRSVPLLTNTWAYPPQVMLMVLDHLAGAPFDEVAQRYSIEIVAMGFGLTNEPLVRSLAGDERWRIVFLDPGGIIFLRAEGTNAELARRFAISPQALGYGSSVTAAVP